MDVKSGGKSNTSRVSYAIATESDPGSSSSIEDNISNIIGREVNEKDRIDTMFLQPEIEQLKHKPRTRFKPLKPLMKLKKKFVTKESVRTNAATSKKTLLSEELSLRAQNTNRMDHEYRKFIVESMFKSTMEKTNDISGETSTEYDFPEKKETLMDVDEVFDLALANYFKSHYNIIANKDIGNNELKGNKLLEVLVPPKLPKEKSKNFVEDFKCLSALINIKEDTSIPKYIVTAPPRSIQRPAISDKEILKRFYTPVSSPTTSIK